MLRDRAQHRRVGLAGRDVVGRRDAAADRLQYAQDGRSNCECAADQVRFAAREIRCRGDDDIWAPAERIELLAHQRLDLADPRVKHERDRAQIEIPSGGAIRRDGDAVGRGLGDRDVERIGQVQSGRFFAAIRLAGPGMIGIGDEQRGGAVAFDPVGEHTNLAAMLGAQTLDRIAPERTDRTDPHAWEFGAGRANALAVLEMRPLGAGEVLDRAVTLFVRSFVPVATAIAVPYVPYLVLQAFVFGNTMQHLMSAASTPGVAPRFMPADLGSYFLTSLLSIVIALFAQTAIYVTLEGAYRGERVPLGTAYRAALARFWNQLGAAILFYFIFTGVLFLIAAVAGLLVLAGVGLHMNGPLAVLGAIIIGIAAIAVIVVAMTMIYMAFALSALSIALARNGAIGALVLAFKTVFGPAQRVRCLVAGLIALAVLFGVEIVAGILGAVMQFALKSYQLEVAAGGVFGILMAGFLSAYVVVFAYDLKVRGQGFDLELALGAAEQTAPA